MSTSYIIPGPNAVEFIIPCGKKRGARAIHLYLFLQPFRHQPKFISRQNYIFLHVLAKYRNTVMEHVVGREDEIKILKATLQSSDAELVAVYGRHRIGKTFLVRQVLQVVDENFGHS